MNVDSKPIGTTFLLKPSGKILLFQRDVDKEEHTILSAWCFPGETIEPRESPLDAVIRGGPEEFQIKLVPEQCTELCRYVHGGVLDVVFVCRVLERTEGVLKEGRDMQWMYLKDIERLVLGWDQSMILPCVKEYLKKGSP